MPKASFNLINKGLGFFDTLALIRRERLNLSSLELYKGGVLESRQRVACVLFYTRDFFNIVFFIFFLFFLLALKREQAYITKVNKQIKLAKKLIAVKEKVKKLEAIKQSRKALKQ